LNFLFAWRYFKSKKTTNAITIIAWVTVLAMAVGTAALIIVLSIFNGFEGLVKGLYSSFYPDVRITSKTSNVMLLTAAQTEQLRRIIGVEALSLVAETNSHLQYGEFRANAVMKGVDTFYYRVSGVPEFMSNGVFSTGSEEKPALVLGSGIENALNLQSDRSLLVVTAYLPKRGAGVSVQPMDAISAMNFQPSGAFAIQQDFDNKYVITNLQTVKQLVGLGEDEYSAAEIRLVPGVDEASVIMQVQQLLGDGYQVENRYQQNRSLFAVMQLEKWAIYGILSLILIIAAFNMIGALTMLVLEKQQDIHILKAMGATNGFIRNVFLAEGLLLALSGGLLGTMAALLFCYLQVTLKLIPLQGSFVIDYYPVQIVLTDLVLILATVIIIALLASWLPSVKASRKQLSLKAQ
jgi:lipoprotein-releasing system permease protein